MDILDFSVKKLLLVVSFVAFMAVPAFSFAHGPTDEEEFTIYLFSQENCSSCAEAKEFLDSRSYNWQFMDIVNDATSTALYEKLSQKHELSSEIPVTVIGNTVFQGYVSPNSTGAKIDAAYEEQHDRGIRNINDHLVYGSKQKIESEVEQDRKTKITYAAALVALLLVSLATVVFVYRKRKLSQDSTKIV